MMPYNIEPAKYKYSTNVKLSSLPMFTNVNSIFPNVEDIVIASCEFDDFESAIISLNLMNAEILETLNGLVQEEQFAIVSELNPAVSEVETISKEWEEGELAKVWIVDTKAKTSEHTPIRAVALTQMVELVSGPEVVLN